jgi:general secretion pathway protein D
MGVFRHLALAVLLALSCVAGAQENWQINLKEADISAFISQVADITGKSFVVDPRVKGKVSVLSKEPLDADGVYELFLSVLQVHSYSAVPAGNVTLIVQENDVKQAGRDLDTHVGKGSQEMLTKVIMIKNTPALDLVPILRPLVAKYGHLAGVKSANALIISDHAVNIARIEQIIDRLDRSGSEELEVVQLKEAWVGNVVTMLQSLDPNKVAQGNADSNNTAGTIRVVADERSNRLIIKGEKTARERIRRLIEQLDQPSYFSGSAQVIRLQYADATKLADMVKNLMNDNSTSKDKDAQQVKGTIGIYADEDLNALVVRAEPSLMKEIQELVKSLDVRRAQVLIESAIVEVSGGKEDSLGVQWVTGDLSAPVGATNFSNAGPSISSIASSVATGDYASALGSGLTVGAYKERNGEVQFGAILQAIESISNTNLLSTPSIMTMDNQEAEIIVGQNVPFITGSTASSTNSNPFNTIERKDVGVSLKVKPHIHDGLDIRLEVEASAESVSTTTVSGSADLITNKRALKTVILTGNKETIVLGGLIRDDVTDTVSKVPLLGDIPLIGWLFRSTSTQHTKTNLMLFLRPTIVNTAEVSRELTHDKYNGIWEFSVSDQLGSDRSDTQVDAVFNGLPIRAAE